MKCVDYLINLWTDLAKNISFCQCACTANISNGFCSNFKSCLCQLNKHSKMLSMCACTERAFMHTLPIYPLSMSHRDKQDSIKIPRKSYEFLGRHRELKEVTGIPRESQGVRGSHKESYGYIESHRDLVMEISRESQQSLGSYRYT